jgi:hypothetical protein
MTWCLLTSSVAAQNLYCSEPPHWKVSGVARSANEGELVLAIEAIDARGMPQVISVPARSRTTRYVTYQSHAGWTFAVHVLEEEQGRTARVGTQAWCDGRMRSYDEAVLPIQASGDRA